MAAPPPQTFPYDYLFKVLIIGDASVGKVSSRVLLLYFDVLMRAAYLRKGEFFFIVWTRTTNPQSSMLLRFTDDSFDEHIQSTIGVDFKVCLR